MDNICEQIVQKARTSGDKAKIAAILILGALLAAAVVFLALISGLWFFILFAIGIMGLGVWLAGNMNVEYEYILTNNEMDIDKVIGRRKRKRMITLDLSNAEEFAAYPSENDIKADVTVHASSGLEKDAHYLVVNHSSYGKVNLIFNPNEKIREAIMQEIPNTLRIKIVHNVKS